MGGNHAQPARSFKRWPLFVVAVLLLGCAIGAFVATYAGGVNPYYYVFMHCYSGFSESDRTGMFVVSGIGMGGAAGLILLLAFAKERGFDIAICIVLLCSWGAGAGLTTSKLRSYTLDSSNYAPGSICYTPKECLTAFVALAWVSVICYLPALIVVLLHPKKYFNAIKSLMISCIFNSPAGDATPASKVPSRAGAAEPTYPSAPLASMEEGVRQAPPELKHAPTRPEIASLAASYPLPDDPILKYIASHVPTPAVAPAASKVDKLSYIKSLQFAFTDVSVSRRLGMGSFGQVFYGTLHETPIALKVLMDTRSIAAQSSTPRELSHASSEPVAAAAPDALLEEVEIMAGLRHPNVVQFLGYCLTPPCIATEFCTRGSLFDVLRAGAADPGAAAELTWQRRVEMAIGGATGMLHLHTRSPQVLHRDMKSPNLLVAADWTVKVADFNLSRLVEGATRNSRASTAGGAATNPRWLAPEIFEDKRATSATDVFAWGLVMWELLTWELPWASVNPYTIPTKILAGVRPALPPTPQLPGLNGQVPAGLERYVALMTRCWAQEPAARPSFQEIISELRQVA